ncbi:MAG: aminotransferase class I/II-fold pyridoxal phosphate-dependent enzyme [candidate division Zixibacteria bacterium]|nr:aminotransferase class I/II-fold pyridoxal phosphate-dependent enzyme [candidate division Zixibacteria bacterium]
MDIFEKCRNYTAAKEIMAAGLYPYFTPLSSGQDTQVIINGKETIMIGSNNYMGLTSHPKVKEAAMRAVELYGSGCSGSRFLNGTLDMHVELERRLAQFMKRETALVFSTGFQTNLGTISALVNKGEYMITDRSDHASIVDGCRLSFGKVLKFKHNDMKDLERVLHSIKKDAGKMIIVDGVFSMEGDIANLPKIVGLAGEYNARVMVDDAHSIGVLGENGRGTGEYFGLEDKIDIVMGTFSKSFASLGGFIVADEPVIHYVKHTSRALIFSASMPPASVAATLAALDIIETEPQRREKLWQIARKMHDGFKRLGFNIGETKTPIIPVYIGEDLQTFKVWKALLEEGVFTNPIISPAVPPGSALLRTSYTATHTDEQLDKVLEIFQKVGKKMGII